MAKKQSAVTRQLRAHMALEGPVYRGRAEVERGRCRAQRSAEWDLMKKLVQFACVVASAALVSTASAAAPTRISIPIDSTAPSALLTAACGFDVSITQVGTLRATVFRDQSGAIIREIDTQPGTQLSLSSSTTGRSFSFPFSSTFRTEFPNGTTPGSEAVVTVTGLGDKVPGIPADAGRIVFADATVLFVNSSGVPIVDFGPQSSSNGHSNSGTTLVTAICSALAP